MARRLPCVVMAAPNVSRAIAPTEEDQHPVVLTDDQRRQLLGRLAEFELALASLPPREQRFALAYITDPTSATRAAEKAGCPEKTAGVQAAKMLKVARIQHAIALGNLIREDRTFVTSERTINELAIIAYSDVTDFLFENGHIRTRDGVPEYSTRAIAAADFVEVDHYDEDGKRTHTTRHAKIKLWSKTDALRMLALYQKLISNALVGSVNITDNSKHLHVHTWKFGDKQLTF